MRETSKNSREYVAICNEHSGSMKVGEFLD